MNINFGDDLESAGVGGHGAAFGEEDPDFEAIFKSQKQDAEDRRRLRGKYTPTPGVCRVCGGKVIAEIAFDHGGRIGGPPVRGHISGWHCEGCFIVYWRCPS